MKFNKDDWKYTSDKSVKVGTPLDFIISNKLLWMEHKFTKERMEFAEFQKLIGNL